MLVGLQQVFQYQTETILKFNYGLRFVSSLFRSANNRNQIRISVRETTRMELIRRLFSFAAQQHQSGRADAFSHVANWATAGRGSRSSASHSPKYGVTSGGY